MHKREESNDKLCDFHLLVYLLEKLDLETVLVIAEDITKQQPINPTILNLLDNYT